MLLWFHQAQFTMGTSWYPSKSTTSGEEKRGSLFPSGQVLLGWLSGESTYQSKPKASSSSAALLTFGSLWKVAPRTQPVGSKFVLRIKLCHANCHSYSPCQFYAMTDNVCHLTYLLFKRDNFKSKHFKIDRFCQTNSLYGSNWPYSWAVILAFVSQDF